MRKCCCTLLLFSFCLLFVSCGKAEVSLEDLALQGKYEQLLDAAQSDFSRTYHKSSLYYMALAQERLGEVKESAESLALYLALAGKQGSSPAARKLAVLVGNRADQPDLVIEMAQLLEEQNQLDETTAKELYQAFLAKGRTEDAHRVFSSYLKGTLDKVAYAQVLIDAHASIALIEEALLSLTKEEAIQMLHSSSTQSMDAQRAYDYYVFAVSYESMQLDDPQKRLLYAALARFASQADLRVQANKYQSLAQPLP